MKRERELERERERERKSEKEKEIEKKRESETARRESLIGGENCMVIIYIHTLSIYCNMFCS